MSRNTPGGEVGKGVPGEEMAQIKSQHTESSRKAWGISTSSARLWCGLTERSW